MNLPLPEESETMNGNDQSDHFLNDVLTGLKSNPKHLSSKYFYDKTGDELFQKIMAMPEYYLTRCELDIFKNKTPELADLIQAYNGAFDLIELGAGDAMKSTFLLKHLIEKGADFTYMPIDISGNILSVLKKNLNKDLPELNVIPLEGEYFKMLKTASAMSSRRKVILFLGGNIGNMNKEEAEQFCREMHRILRLEDIIFIGFDIKKNPHTVLKAYNDPAGITAAFNLNLLSRINRELGGNFNPDHFQHYQTYDPLSGSCRSFLISLTDQEVTIGDESILFRENEVIDMEVSQKFSHDEIRRLAEKTGFKVAGEIKDSKSWFVDSIWKKDDLKVNTYGN
ncbi:L-histidine N(alpha)-methyltransferase [Chryseobacterium sp. SSA4.19]|uniref:L-histidine N(alpha)-methyltransferase n=1 Tax=Chryseobacterium sp. SSA4.19 TaxID=2919915 RepID=UPI001F4DB726|nr:L-histidine N(alpha)-methyltransferase [Chryseobacterium sp. SSA4.19]MCJ8155104.1 L-histidine N(alpha)-methyltransferase [Chryseobacterium sp. SSA4.19]